MDIIEGNKLIAEFMGTPYKFPRTKFSNGEVYEEEVLPQYHTLWDWLMPVIGKINKIEITGSQARLLKIYRLSHFSPMEELYEAVTQFILWYNTQPKTTTIK